jgi:hypothetical protein
MTVRQKDRILRELRQLRRTESHLQAKFETLRTSEPNVRWSFLDSLEQWKMQAQVLDNLLDNHAPA